MATIIDELVTILGVDIKAGVVPVVQKFSSMVEGIASKAAWASAALMTAASSAAYFAAQANADSAEIEKFGRLTGVSTKSLQGLSFAAEQAGGSAGSLQQDLLGLTKSMSSPVPGEFNHALFMLGINARDAKGQLRSADQVLLDIADKLQGMDEQTQLQWASKIGLSDDTLLLLQMGRREIAAFQKQAEEIPVIVDEKQLKDARDFTVNLMLLRRVVAYLRQEISSAAGPVVKQIVGDFVSWVKVNREWLQQNIREKVEGITTGVRRFWSTLKHLKDVFLEIFPYTRQFVEGLGNIELTATLVQAGLFLLAGTAVFFAAKFALVGLAFTAAALVVEDFITWMRGGDSIIGRVIESVKAMGKEFADTFPGMTGLVEDLWGAGAELGELFAKDLVNGTNGLMRVLLFMGRGIEQIAGWVMRLVDNFLMLLGFGRNQSLMDWLFGGDDQEPPIYDPWGERELSPMAIDGGVEEGPPPSRGPALQHSRSALEQQPPENVPQESPFQHNAQKAPALTNPQAQVEKPAPPPASEGRERSSFLHDISLLMYRQALVLADFQRRAQAQTEGEGNPFQFPANFEEMIKEVKQAQPMLQQAPASPSNTSQIIQVPRSDINIHQTIQSTNPVGAASESARQNQQLLQTLFPGGLVPVVN